MTDVAPASTGAPSQGDSTRKRPRLNLGALTGGERKRGKSMLGLMLGTLNKAKVEDKERNASEAVGFVTAYLDTENPYSYANSGEEEAVD